jgi:hypothetical protein
MLPNDAFHQLLSKHKMQFYWNEYLHFWWLETRMVDGRIWQSAFFTAGHLDQAKAAAEEYLKNFDQPLES